MSNTKANPNRYKRHKTRHRGITYRLKDDGSRTYYVYAAGKQIAFGGGEREALTKQAEIRGKLARGERVAPNKIKFAEAAEEWFASKTKLRRSTRVRYRGSLKLWLLPKLGHVKLVQITPDCVA